MSGHPHHPEGFCTLATCEYQQAQLARLRGEEDLGETLGEYVRRHPVLGGSEEGYFVAVVTRTAQWFDGPFTDADKAQSMADAYNRDPYRNAVVIGVR